RLRAVSYDAVRVGRVLVDAELRVGIAVDVGIEGAGEHDRVVARIPFDARTERPGEPWLETWVTEALDAVDALATLARDEVFAPIVRECTEPQVLQWTQRLRIVVRRLGAPVVVDIEVQIRARHGTRPVRRRTDVPELQIRAMIRIRCHQDGGIELSAVGR